MTRSIITKKSIGEIKGEFYVPDYQRGYRWQAQQVHILLDDIFEFLQNKTDHSQPQNYFLQPIVVKKIKLRTSDTYELIDGQQRLTTLYLIYACLNKTVEDKDIKQCGYHFSFDEKARPESRKFLESFKIAVLNSDAYKNNIDFFHMAQAYQCVENWLDSFNEHAKVKNAKALLDALENYVQVLWYEVARDSYVEPRKIFLRLNMGKIPLTNAELIKAWLLAPPENERLSIEDLRVRQALLSAQWDMIERHLQQDSFWYFITGENASHYMTRIDLLFNMTIKNNSKLSGTYNVFFTVSSLFQKNPLAVWEKVLSYYQTLRSWYEDIDTGKDAQKQSGFKETYHEIGFLIATGTPVTSLIERSLLDKKNEFRKFIKKEIKTKLKINNNQYLKVNNIEYLDYLENRELLNNIILLFNVLSVMKNANELERYPFHFHNDVSYKWSLEHIHARNVEGINTEGQWRNWLKFHMQMLERVRFPTDADEDKRMQLYQDIKEHILQDIPITQNGFDSFANSVFNLLNDDADGKADEWVDGLGNLALLDCRQNSQLNNAVFAAKQFQILDMCHRGEYVPLSTQRVFMRFYTATDNETNETTYNLTSPYWSKADRESYIAALKETLKEYLELA